MFETLSERLNFLLTNRIPRYWSTILFARFSRWRCPAVMPLMLGIWQYFGGDLRLSDAKKERFSSLHDCFIRELKPGVRKIDNRPAIVTSPVDALVGCAGKINDDVLFQAKGFPYRLGDLMPSHALREKYRDGTYVTLRLTSTMYHRFHAPANCTVRRVDYVSGDTWNVNPIALKRIDRLFCKNERVVLDLEDLGFSAGGLAVVPIAAILVASIKLHCLPYPLDLKYRGANSLNCQARYRKGEEMGYFQHGSTVLLFGTRHFKLLEHIKLGDRISLGDALFQHSDPL